MYGTKFVHMTGCTFIILLFIFYIVVEIVLTETDYLVEEGLEVNVCARLTGNYDSCIVPFPLILTLITSNGQGIR